MKRQLLSLFLFLFTSISFGQDLHWNNAPHKGFVFQITNNEAQKLLTRSSSDTIISRLLHTQVDTFDVRKGWTNRPSKGHFILARIVGNKINCEYTSVFPYQVFLLKEYNALALQVLDLEGNVRTDAKVRFRFKKIRIDTTSKTYRVENEWFNGKTKVVTVELDGFRSVFNIEKHEAPEWNNYSSYSDGPSFYSYMITDKNKYKPGEKVRFKSYALTQSRTPMHRDLQLWLMGDRGKKLAKITPHRPGSYVGEFQLHDSLKLSLDRAYYLNLMDRSGRVVAHCSFYYEDYELNGNELDIKLSNYDHYYPKDNTLTITATDANGLILKDARATVTVMTHNIAEVFQPVAILKDTLITMDLNLDPDQPTPVNIPNSIFQKTNTTYDVIVSVLNSENKKIDRRLLADYYYSQYQIRSRLVSDSIVYEMFDNGKNMSGVAATIRHNNEVSALDVKLPYKEKLNPVVSFIEVKTKDITRKISMNEMVPQLELTGGIKKDSLNITLVNPQKLEISWFIYKGADLIQKSSGKEMKFDSLITDRSLTYYVELLYSFGGQDQVKRKSYEFRDGILDVALNIPERAFPGQTVDALIQVTNEAGRPVSNVDLTALAVTSKLHYVLPDLPYYGNVSSSRSKRATYSKTSADKRVAKLKLSYDQWKKKAGLDTMKYYQFTYPGSRMFKHTVAIDDRTQFAPFVMKDGMAQQVYVVELNRIPVYYYWVNQPREYSFYAEPDRICNVTVRLFDRVLIFDTLRFERGKKTILSVDLDHLPSNVKTVKFDLPKKKNRKDKVYPSFTPIEIARHLSYVASFQYVDGPAYLESPGQFTPLFPPLHNLHAPITVGPIMPGMQTFYGIRKATQTRYNHQGGFRYAFEDNIVYKTDVEKLIPERLYQLSFDPLRNINDKAMTREVFLNPKIEINRWHTRVIEFVDTKINVKVLLPEEKEASGLRSFLFENTATGQLISPCEDRSKDGSKYYTVPRGLHNVIVIFNNGNYLKKDSIELMSYTHVVVDLNQATLNTADDLSERWMNTAVMDCYRFQTPYQYQRTLSIRESYPLYGNIRGVIYAEDNSPLPGANIVIKGTVNGTVTNADGQFAIDADESVVTLVISFIGYVTQEIDVQIGSDISVVMDLDVTELSEVVVVGYGVQSSREMTGALSGRVAGVQITQPEDDEVEEEESNEVQEAEDRLYTELLNLKTIRSNFSDVGFWEPKLYTDRHGEAKFSVTWPDDITQWNATVYAMNRQLQTGTTRKHIKSYKPIMAELAVPNFLTVGDSSVLIGKVSNYTNDKNITGKVTWKSKGGTSEKQVQFNSFQLDNLPVSPTDLDSVTTSFVFTRDDGYLDGEERKVPVVQQGVERADGILSILNNNDPVKIKARSNDKITVQIMADAIDIYAGEVQYLLNYRYDCNEQLASKLIGFVNYKLLMQYEGKLFKYDKDVNRIIGRLLRNQNEEFLWSWWDVSPGTSYWMSAHILQALKIAADAGYRVDLNLNNLKSKLEYRLDMLHQYSTSDIQLINVLALWGVKLKYEAYVQHLDSMVWSEETYMKRHRLRYSLLKEKMLLLETKQLAKLPFKTDSILQHKKDGILGEAHFSDDLPSWYWFSDELTVNTIAYRIVKRDSTLRNLTTPMQLYFIGQRNKNQWNTYHSASVLSTVLPDLIASGATKKQPSTIALEGKVNTTITKFPYKVDLEPGEELTVGKESGLPAYLMQYRKERVTKAKTGVEGFEITTRLGNNSRTLEAGKPVTLTVEVNLTKDAEMQYVMIEVPVPGSCSYGQKIQWENSAETHREYFKEKTAIFCENMKAGKYTFNINLLPRFTGKYHINPSQVSLMYIPVVNANTDMKTVMVK